MKLVYFGIIIVSLLIATSYVKSVHADSADPVQILDVQVESSTLKVNDTFSISATILNSSPYPIYLTSGSCTPAFSVSFDIHAKQVHPDIACTLEAIEQKVDPQGEVTISNANKPGTIYQAVLAGTANANITIPYSAKNQTATDYSNIDYSISKSFQFVIHGSNETAQNMPAYFLPPLQQIRAGTLIQNVKCSANFNLIIKSEDGSPTCVKSDTAKILSERGWTGSITNGIPQTSDTQNTKNYDPFGITALVIYKPSAGCLISPSNTALPVCPPNNFYLKINSNSTAYLVGYNICDGDSCTKSNDLSISLPINTGLKPDYQIIGLPINLQWHDGDLTNIQLEISPTSDNKTGLPLDIGNSMIVPQ